MAIVSALPVTLVNGTTADATQVMQDFSHIVSQTNTNAAEKVLTPQLGTPNTFTQACIFSQPVTAAGAILRSHLAQTAQVQDGRFNYLTGVAGTNAITGTVIINPGAYVAGQRFTFVPAVTNTAAVTLNVNGLGAQPVLLSGNPLGLGVLRAGKVVSVVWTGSAFQLVEGAWGGGRPVGSMVTLAGGTTPPDVLLAFGQTLDRATYADLFNEIGGTYGAPSGTTFSAPDCQGRVVIGRDAGGANRITVGVCGINSTTLGAVGGGEHAHAHAHGFTGGTSSVDGAHSHTTGIPVETSQGSTIMTLSNHINNTNVATYTSSTHAGHTHTMGGTVGNTFGGNTQNVQPSIVMNVGIVY